MHWDDIVRHWQATLEAVERLGGLTEKLIVEVPATEAEVLAVESRLGLRLPASFRETLLTSSRAVDLFWQLPHQKLLGDSFEDLIYGVFRWSLSEISEIEASKQGWITETFPSWGDAEDETRWDDTFAFHTTRCGDFLAIDLSRPGEEPVIYLSHDDDTYNRCKLGKDFQDFLNRTAPLGSPGGECWQWAPFLHSDHDYIDPNCQNAVEWKRVLGL